MLSPPFGRVVGSDCHCSLRGRDYYESEYNPDGYRKQETMARRYPRRLKVIPARLGSLSDSRGRLPEPSHRNGPETRVAPSWGFGSSAPPMLPSRGGGFYSGVSCRGADTEWRSKMGHPR